MKEKKRNWTNFLFPPVWLTVVLVCLCTSALVFVFFNHLEETVAAYAAYVLSFYTLSVVCIACLNVFPRRFKQIRQKVYDNTFGNRYLTDPAFKMHVNLYRSLVINLLYAVFNLYSGIYYSTAWFMLLAGYYALMAIMRFLLLRHVSKNGIGQNRLKELKRSKLCACILMTVNLSLSGAVLMMLNFDRGFEYSGILIYIVAMYTFYITSAAIVNVVKYKKFNSPVMSMATVINLAAALVSMLSLETAMLTQFGGDTSPETRRVLIVATGAGISIVVFFISMYTIWKTDKEIKTIKIKNSQT